MKIKKFISMVCVLTLIFAVATAQTATVQAAGGLTLTQLMAKFPDGKYWDSFIGHNNPDGYTSVPCGHSYYDGRYNTTCTEFDGSCQCYGFANKCFYDVYGRTPEYDSKVYNLNGLKAGDIVRYKNDGHSVFVVGVKGEDVYVGECNWDYECGISWGRHTTKSELNRTLTYRYVAPYEMKVFNGNSGYLNLGAELVWSFEMKNENGKLVSHLFASHTDGDKSDIWTILRQSDGSYKIRSEYDGKFITANSTSPSDGTGVSLQTATGSKVQNWYIFKMDYGYMFKSACAELVLSCFDGADDHQVLLRKMNFGNVGERFCFSDNTLDMFISDYYKNNINTAFAKTVFSKYPFANIEQLNSCVDKMERLAFVRDDEWYSTVFKSEVLDCMAKLNYDFPTVSGDFNGDGRDDVAQFTMNVANTAQIDVMYSNGSTFTRKNNVWNSGIGWNVGMFTHRMVVGDFNGDKRDDIAAFYDYGKGECRLFVWESTGSGFRLNWNYWYMKTGYYPTRINDRVVAGDFNNDGKDDICAFYDYGKGECRAFVWESKGSYFSMNWNYWYMRSGFDASRLDTRVVTGDYNGDRRDDVCAFYDYGKGECRAFVWESVGGKLNLKWNYWYMSSGFTASRLNGRVTAGDYNGDGKDDICAFYDYGKGELRAFVWQSTGKMLNMNWNWWYMPSGFYSDNLTGRVVSGDFNGDKKDDVGAYYCYSAGADQGKGRMFVYQSTGSNFGLKWNWYFG